MRAPGGALQDLVDWMQENSDLRVGWYAAIGNKEIEQNLSVKAGWAMARKCIHER
jgi:hypothetical protein